MCDEYERVTIEGKGTYLLLIRLSTAREITVGHLGLLRFEPGGYIYVGSALGGLKRRIARHLRQHKKYHWHIDYLLKYSRVDSVLTIETDKRLECKVAAALGKYFAAVHKFGSSDCKCPSHLFYHRNIEEMRLRAAETINLMSKQLS